MRDDPAMAGSLPALSLLDPVEPSQETVSPETIEYTSRLIEKKLSDFGVSVTVVAAQAGPVITRYEIEPATGVKGSQVVNLAKDLARSLSLVSIRVVETIPGKNYMALELPNAKRQTIRLAEILGSQVYADAASQLTMGLGKDIIGAPVVADLAKMPHCLVAGTTGSGKSVGINAMILSLLYKAEARDVRLILIDPKMLEMSVYEGIPHLLAPVVTDMKQAANALNWCVGEMERRYKLMSKLGVRNLAGYNKKIDEAAAPTPATPIGMNGVRLRAWKPLKAITTKNSSTSSFNTTSTALAVADSFTPRSSRTMQAPTSTTAGRLKTPPAPGGLAMASGSRHPARSTNISFRYWPQPTAIAEAETAYSSSRQAPTMKATNSPSVA